MSKKAIILFSGGLDSTTCLAIAKSKGFSCYALTFAYGQNHQVEIERTKDLAKLFQVVEHKILSVPLNEIRGSSLTDPSIAIPDFSNSTDIPSTYVPARNTIFLSFALAWAEVVGAHDIFFGANHIDYSGYPDCRPDYIHAFERMATLGTKTGSEGNEFYIHAPLLQMNKAEIIQEGIRLGIDYSQTVSCYRADAEGRACGKCDSCHYRKKGFADAHVTDPTLYVEVAETT